MFTGLVEEIGRVRGLKKEGDGYLLEIEAASVPSGVRPGDSVCVNGVCQTVTSNSGTMVRFFVSAVTAGISTLATLKNGSPVNLERAMSASSRFDGHIVQGHVDGTGRIKSLRQDASGRALEIEVPEKLARYMVARGSVCVDGISLTVVDSGRDWFSLYIIPRTASESTAGTWKQGDIVNIETDILARYVEKMLGKAADGNSAPADEADLKKKLYEEGFI